MKETVLVRYGAIPEVSRFEADASHSLPRGSRVIVRTHRGVELGTVLEHLDGRSSDGSSQQHDDQDAVTELSIIRPASLNDEAKRDELQADCQTQFADWCRRIEGWNLDLELIDLEWTFDQSKLILYVLNERGPDCTKLALQAAAAGLGTIEVQPVDSGGLVRIENSGGGCGSGGGSCGCSM